MKSMLSAVVLSAAVSMLPLAAYAQAPADAPAGSMGQCKDGTYSTNATKSGACSGHKGVKTWYGPAKGAAPVAATSTTPAAVPAAAATPAPAAAASPAAAATTSPAAPAAKTAMPSAPAAGGGPGMVWVNGSGSKVYHCPGSKYYGKTKAGSYMTEDAAKAAGNHADHGKACS